MKTRTVSDSFGDIQVPENKYWGAQTQRSLKFFQIGDDLMPIEVIYALAIIKKATATANYELDVLDKSKKESIIKVCDEIIKGELNDHFPLSVWQTGSGTQTNMNINEVIANRSNVLLSAHDDVNKSQSSNDVFPTAMHISSYKILVEKTIPSINNLKDELQKKSNKFKDIIKVGRTHFMDATPLTLGQEISGYVSQLDHGLKALNNSLSHIKELALGATAVGTGINTPRGFSSLAINEINKLTKYKFIEADNKFEALACHDALVSSHAALKQIATSLMKIGNDIRMLGSGPRAGLAELILPANEPGSSIMPGKVNPTQCEALTMVCAQVIANDLAITIGGMNGHFELNVFKPLIIFNFLNSARLLTDACNSFNTHCIQKLKVNRKHIKHQVDSSLMLITSLNSHIGYAKSSLIVNEVLKNNTSLKEEAIKSGFVSLEQFNLWVNPRKMLGEG